MRMRCGITVARCVCVPGATFHTVTNWPQRPTKCLSAAEDSITTCFFFVKQLLHKATEFALKLLVQVPAILFAFASTRVYCNHVMLLSTTWCCGCQLCVCNIVLNVELNQVAFIGQKEGKFTMM